MAETMTYDPGTDTITTGDSLTPDEQESLKVGEVMEAEQEQLLAGKYKDAQELEKAYVELQKKLGEQESNTEETTEEVDSEVAPADGYKEDGSVDYDSVNNTYGDKLGNLFKENNVNPWEISKHFHETQGEITEEMNQTLLDTGLSQASIDSYLAGRAAQMGYNSEAVSDLSDREVQSVQDSVGGSAEYNNIVEWASDNLDADALAAYDNVVSSGNAASIKLAAAGLKAQYENANGYEGRMLTGKPPRSSGDVFRSQPELVEAMSDPRYDRDPAYRQDVIDKLDRSDLNF
tara:strand:+ start:2321 stop:3190 length:870 start_codon:yes stop_codon:yes gene_type:complete